MMQVTASPNSRCALKFLSLRHRGGDSIHSIHNIHTSPCPCRAVLKASDRMRLVVHGRGPGACHIDGPGDTCVGPADTSVLTLEDQLNTTSWLTSSHCENDTHSENDTHCENDTQDPSRTPLEPQQAVAQVRG